MKKIIIKTLIMVFVISPMITNAAVLNRQLELGMRGVDVGTLQTFLAQDKTIYPQGLITDYFGSLTKSAVSNFQSRNNISSIGRVGPQTLSVINSQINLGSMNVSNYSNPNIRIIGDLSLSTYNNQVSMSWNTGVETTAAIYYSKSPLILNEASENNPFSISGGNLIVLNSDLRTSHMGTITGLDSNTLYYYVVYVKDSQGNESILTPSTFVTSN